MPVLIDVVTARRHARAMCVADITAIIGHDVGHHVARCTGDYSSSVYAPGELMSFKLSVMSHGNYY